MKAHGEANGKVTTNGFSGCHREKKKKQVKEVPTFIANKHSRISLAIKFLLSKNLENKKLTKFFKEFKKEILLSSQKKSTTCEFKNNLQKQVFLKKRFLTTFFKWK